MADWFDAYQRLPEDVQERVKTWLRLQQLIALSLKVSWEEWIDRYIAYAMEHPLDYSFMEAVISEFAGFEAIEGQGVSFTKALDAATALTARVPLRARNNLGRLSPDLQDAIAGMLEASAPAEERPLLPADVAQLQKIFIKEKALAKLKKDAFKRLVLERDGDDMTLTIKDGAEVLRLNVLEFGAILSRALV